MSASRISGRSVRARLIFAASRTVSALLRKSFARTVARTHPAFGVFCDPLERRLLLSATFTYNTTYLSDAPHDTCDCGGSMEVAKGVDEAGGGDPADLGFSPACATLTDSRR